MALWRAISRCGTLWVSFHSMELIDERAPVAEEWNRFLPDGLVED
jgi:hypothetical protein